MNISEFLSRLQGVKSSGKGYISLCPGHNDRNASLSIGEGEDGRILLKCLAGCGTDNILNTMGLEFPDLFPAKKKVSSSKPVKAQGGCTLKQYADAKKLPIEFLTSIGLQEIIYNKAPAVRIPYYDQKGNEVCVQFRKGLSGDGKLVFKSGSHPTLYGLSQLPDASDYISLAEGPSDTQTLWFNGFPAIGLPSASFFKDDLLTPLSKFTKLLVTIEQDEGGKQVLNAISKSKFRDKVFLVSMNGIKDPSELYLKDPASFKTKFQALLDEAIPWIEYNRKEQEAQASEAWEKCKDLANAPSILDLFTLKLNKCGVVGEERLCKTIFLCFVSRVFDRPTSAGVKGISAGGKSYSVETVSKFFPGSAFFALSGMSEHALAYTQEPLSHRFLIIYEAAGLLSSDLVSYLVRSLLSEGKIRYSTVIRGQNGLEPVTIEKEGPTGLIVTTTAVSLHPENETRMLTVTVNDSRDQTREVFRTIAKELPTPDLSEWVALGTWLESGEHRVAVPYAERLADLIPPIAVRLRRDFTSLLSLIKAHALLHRTTRTRDSEGRIVATLTDYAVVRELAGGFISENVGALVSETVREVVLLVKNMLPEEQDKKNPETVSVSQIAQKLELDKSSTSRRVKQALAAGYLINHEERKGRPYKILLGEPLPEEIDLLPSVERLGECCPVVLPLQSPSQHLNTTQPIKITGNEADRCTVAHDSGGIERIPTPPVEFNEEEGVEFWQG